jgi:hypothetical protein
MCSETDQSNESNESGSLPQTQVYVPLNSKYQGGNNQDHGKNHMKMGILGWFLLVLAIASSVLGVCFFLATGNVVVVAVFNAPLLAIIAAYYQSHFRT